MNADHTDDASHDDLLAEQVTRFFNGPIDPAELAQLQARLETDASARRFFVRVAIIDGHLTEQSLQHKHELREDLLADGQDQDARQLSLHDATVQIAIRDDEVSIDPEEKIEEETFQPALLIQSSNGSQGGGQFPSPWIIRISAAAAVVLIGVLIAVWAMAKSNHRQLARSISVQTETSALIGSQVQAKWDSDSPSLSQGDVVPGQPMHLKSGWVRLDFPSGVNAVIEAPARFQVLSNSKVSLDLGRITAVVPLAGHGFSVQSPTCQVVDLGTEFGMAVGTEGTSEVQVFKGSVSFSSKNSGDGGSRILLAGEGRSVDSQGASTMTIAADAQSFVRVEQFNRWVSASTAGVDDATTFNEQLSRDPSLMLFYPLMKQEQVIKNHAVRSLGLYDLPCDGGHGPGWVPGRVPGSYALDFDGSKHQYLVLPACPLTQTGELTGSVWINVRSYVPFGSILKNWGSSLSGTFHLGLDGITHDLEIELDGTRADGPHVRDKHFVPLGQWVHIAFVSDGSTVRLYRDGQEVASAPSRPIQIDPPIKCLSIGCKTGDDGLTPAAGTQSGFWDGQIGEMAFFDRALSADEILRISRHGRR